MQNELSNVDKLRLHVEKLLDKNISKAEISTMFLYEVLKEIDSTGSSKLNEDPVIVSGGSFK